MAKNTVNSYFDFEQSVIMADLSPAMIWITDSNKNYLYFNPEWLDFIEFSPEQEQFLSWRQSVHPDDLHKYLNTFSDAFNRKVLFKTTYRIKLKGGMYRRVMTKGTPQYTRDGAFWGYIGLSVDLDLLQEGDTDESTYDQYLSDELSAINEELQAANEELATANEDLKDAQDGLSNLNSELEAIVSQRTAALAASESEAQTLNEELRATNEELTATNEELFRSNDELYNSREHLREMNEVLLSSKVEIEKRERLFKSIAINIPNSLILVVDKEHRFITIEGDLMEKMGYHGKDFQGKHPTEVTSPERYEQTRHLYERMFTGEKFTTERRSADGAHFLVSFVPLENEQGEVYAGLIIAIDISHIKEAEEKSAHLASIVASSDDAIISKTLNSIVTSWNHSAERLFGYSAEEMIGQPILKLIPPERLDEEEQILRRLKGGEHVQHFETVRQTKDGRLIFVSLTISPVKDSTGKIIGVSKIVRDITERKEDEQRKNDFIAMVSHELKTPLTTLTAIIQLLELKLRQHEDLFVSGATDKAIIQVKKMTGLINGFLDISRLESGKLQIEKKDFDIEALIIELIEETRFTAPDHSINFTASGSKLIYADRDKIGSVISNLLNNATKYSPAGNNIDVDCHEVDGFVQICIKDYGSGINEYDAKRIFERFYRAETRNHHHISGFGIGLYLCFEIIERHNGTIWVESEVGKGARFCFRLPVS